VTDAAVLFDLDGTLVDTAADLVDVLNRLLSEKQRPPMPYAIARNRVSEGAAGLLRLGFGADLPTDALADLRRRFLEIYLARICVKSRIFKEIEDVLYKYYEVKIRWGIVTNKPQTLTMALLRGLGIEALPGCVVGGDRLAQRKPDPAPLLLAADELGAAPAQCVYVGDAERDVVAGRAAGMRTAVAAYGYIRPSIDPASWGADAVVRHPRDLAGVLGTLGVTLR
jgi:2-phosphoglycolate phosphatase